MLIGMPEAAKRAGYSRSNSIQRALTNADVKLVKINERAYAVEETDLEAFLRSRTTVGRPPKDKAPSE